eukprot:3908449-Amphidinium_carterae.1
MPNGSNCPTHRNFSLNASISTDWDNFRPFKNFWKLVGLEYLTVEDSIPEWALELDAPPAPIVYDPQTSFAEREPLKQHGDAAIKKGCPCHLCREDRQSQERTGRAISYDQAISLEACAVVLLRDGQDPPHARCQHALLQRIDLVVHFEVTGGISALLPKSWRGSQA